MQYLFTMIAAAVLAYGVGTTIVSVTEAGFANMMAVMQQGGVR